MIPLVDLAAQHARLALELEPAALEVLRSQKLILGVEVQRFEAELSSWLGLPGGVGVSSGTDALLLALIDAGIGSGDEVITTSLSFVASAEVIARVGARPVFVDVEPSSLSLDVGAVEAAIGPRTRAVLTVHLFGHVGRVDELASLCQKRGILLIEDCAQALGARLGERAVGTFGDYAAFSFFPAKILGAAGDGGLVTSSHLRLEELRRLRGHGHSGAGLFPRVGGNFRLDALQAALLRVKLRHLEDFLVRRRQRAERYLELFSELDGGALRLLHPRDGVTSAWNYFVIVVPEPESLLAALNAAGVGATRYYPVPLHRQPCFAEFGAAPSLPICEEACRGLVALPLCPEISFHSLDRVAEVVRGHLGG